MNLSDLLKVHIAWAIISDFEAICAQKVDLSDYPFADIVKKNIKLPEDAAIQIANRVAQDLPAMEQAGVDTGGAGGGGDGEAFRAGAHPGGGG